MHRIVWVLLLAGIQIGCATREKAGAPPARGGAIVTPATGTFGRVVSVNSVGRFVVLSYPVGTLPALEKRLNAYRNGLKVAELKVTGPTRDTHIVADVLAGECQAGDVTRED